MKAYSQSPHLNSVIVIGLLFVCIPAQAQWVGATHDTLTRDSFRDEVSRQAIAIDNANTQHAVWQRALQGGGWRIFYARKPASSAWSSAREVGDSSIQAFTPALAVDPVTYTAYVLYRATYSGNDEIVCARDSAGTWIRTRLTNNNSQDLSPTIALDRNGNVHAAWIGQDTSLSWKIVYATDLSGTWRTHLLTGSELGSFGSGAEPFLAVTTSGVAHIFYRGGDFGTYRIHHAWNTQPGDPTWMYEIVSTPNGNDFSASAVIDEQGTIHLLASGNDGFGFPPRAYYLRKPTTGGWSTPERANQGGNGWGGVLVIDRFGRAHITWNETSGNIYTGNLFYATNRTGMWASTSILSDGKTYNGTLALDGTGRGHVIAYNGETFQTQEILVIHSSGVLTSVGDNGGVLPGTLSLFQNYPNPFPAHGGSLPVRQAGAPGGNPTTSIRFHVPTSGLVSLKVFDVLGREVTTLVNDVKQAGEYRVEFSANDRLANGVYFYRLEAGAMQQTRTMMLLR